METTTNFNWAMSQITEWITSHTNQTPSYSEIQLNKQPDENEFAFLAKSQYIDLSGNIHPTALIVEGLEFNISGNIIPVVKHLVLDIVVADKKPVVLPIVDVDAVLSGDAAGFAALTCQVMMYGKTKNSVKSLNTFFKFRNGLLSDVG